MNNAAGSRNIARETEAGLGHRHAKRQNQVLDKLGLSAPEQKQDTNYMDGIQGPAQRQRWSTTGPEHDWQQLAGETGKTKACDLVLKQGMNFIS